jgi:hypothetical protein
MIDRYKQFISKKKKQNSRNILQYKIEKYQDKIEKETSERKR